MPFDPLTIVFAVVAVLAAWKLHSVLGQNSGFQRPRPPSSPNGAFGERKAVAAAGSNVIRLPGSAPVADPARWNGVIESDSAAAGLDAIAAADPKFAADSFLGGARLAYESIVTAFAAGDRKTLQNLLAPDVYRGFDAAIAERERKGETLSTTFVSIDDAKVRSALLNGRIAQVAVRFLSKQISATHGADGALLGGSPDRVADMDDIWTFSRDVSSRDPNWKLVATESGH